MLKATFTSLTGNYTSDPELVVQLWTVIEKHYSGKKRYYHNLAHLENMFAQLQSCQDLIEDRDTVLFALFYHDIIYKATAKDNEEKSAEAAIKALHQISYPDDRISKCEAMILATKSHTLSSDNDTNLFTDADLSILGSDRDSYDEYCRNVRKEYSIYPDFMYNPGRKKVVQHFLDMQSIFKTAFFIEKYEEKARENLSREIGML
jgi:predicted metal-dependent HD superfamily phosphohydrolase